eukprot:407633-Pelagomonas_calceolata.AAC.3
MPVRCRHLDYKKDGPEPGLPPHAISKVYSCKSKQNALAKRVESRHSKQRAPPAVLQLNLAAFKQLTKAGEAAPVRLK